MLDAVERTMRERAVAASPENYFKSLVQQPMLM
jgi:hypothetical protein